MTISGEDGLPLYQPMPQVGSADAPSLVKARGYILQEVREMIM